MPRFIHLSIWNVVDWRVKSSTATMEAPALDGKPEIGRRRRMHCRAEAGRDKGTTKAQIRRNLRKTKLTAKMMTFYDWKEAEK